MNCLEYYCELPEVFKLEQIKTFEKFPCVVSLAKTRVSYYIFSKRKTTTC